MRRPIELPQAPSLLTRRLRAIKLLTGPDNRVSSVSDRVQEPRASLLLLKQRDPLRPSVRQLLNPNFIPWLPPNDRLFTNIGVYPKLFAVRSQPDVLASERG